MSASVSFSVLIPVYNTSAFLDKCLHSVVNASTGYNVEIIVVDDGSTDDSLELCRKIASCYKSIHVFSKNNGGLVSARKFALSKSKGDYILNVDSDDWVEPDLFEVLCNVLEKGDFDIISFDFYQGNENSKIERNQLFDEGYYCGENLLKINSTMLYDIDNRKLWRIFPNIWCKLMRREIAMKFQNQIPDDISFGEDAAVIYPAFLGSNNIFICHKKLYNYRDNCQSMVRAYDKCLFLKEKRLFDYLAETAENTLISEQFHYYCVLMMNHLIVNELKFPKNKLVRHLKEWAESDTFSFSIRKVKLKSLTFKNRTILFLLKNKFYRTASLLCLLFKRRLLRNG